MFLAYLALGLYYINHFMTNHDGDILWSKFKIDYNRSYNSHKEEERKREIFMENLRALRLHNLKYLSNLSTFKYDINDFSDVSFAEFYEINTARGAIEDDDKSLIKIRSTKYFFNLDADKIPKSFDWRNHGGISKVKNQGNCGSCYAFSVLDAIENFHYNRTGKSVDLSEQEIVDCGRGYSIAGCNGGYEVGVLSYIKKNGISLESDYPYEAKRGTCKINTINNKLKIKFRKVLENARSGDEEAMKRQLLTHGPIITSMDHLHDSFMRYSSGIYYESDCNATAISSHSVLLVGYGTDEKGVDYWIVKNSFGEKWGEKGYFRIARNRNNHCLIASEAYSIL